MAAGVAVPEHVPGAIDPAPELPDHHAPTLAIHRDDHALERLRAHSGSAREPAENRRCVVAVRPATWKSGSPSPPAGGFCGGVVSAVTLLKGTGMNDGENRFTVAMALLMQGQREEAHGALHSCIAANDLEWSPHAASVLAESLLEAGDMDGAEAAVGIAVRSGHPLWMSRALVVGGVLHARRGDRPAAKRAYSLVISLDADQSTVANAWFNLGTTFQEEGDVDMAIDAFGWAIAIAPATLFAARAGVNLGYLLAIERGEVDRARDAFQAVIAIGDPEQSELARMNLAALDQVARGNTSVADPTVDLAAGVERVTGERTPRRWRIFGRNPDG